MKGQPMVRPAADRLKLSSQAKRRGSITYAELETVFPPSETGPKRLGEAVPWLAEMGISVCKEGPGYDGAMAWGLEALLDRFVGLAV